MNVNELIKLISSAPVTLFILLLLSCGLFFIFIAVTDGFRYKDIFEIQIRTNKQRIFIGIVGVVLVLSATLGVLIYLPKPPNIAGPGTTPEPTPEASPSSTISKPNPKSIELKEDGAPIDFLPERDEINSVRIGQDGKLLVCGGDDNIIRFWKDINKRNGFETLGRHDNNVLSVAINRDGKIVASGGKDNTIKVWNLRKKELLYKLNNPPGDWINSVAISRNNQYLVSGSYDHSVRVWNLSNGALIDTIEHGAAILSVAISLDSNTVISGSADGVIKVWDLVFDKVEELGSHSGPVWSLDISQDNKLVSGSEDDTVKVWNLTTKKLLYDLQRPKKVCRSDANNSGKPKDGPLPDDCPYADVNTVAISADGQLVASGSDDKTISFWDLNTGEFIKTVRGHEREVFSVTFNPQNNQQLVSGGADYFIRFWKLSY